MRLVAWAASTAFLFMTSGALADGVSDRSDPSALVAALSSADEAARQDAAERIIKSGSFTIERVARRAAALDDAAWGALVDALTRRNWLWDAVTLVAAAHDAPEAHRGRLLELARRLDPRAGTTVTDAEMEALVRKLLVEQRGLISDHDPYPSTVAVHGHAGVPVVLKLLRENGDDVVDSDRASAVLGPMAQPEDIPALRRLLLAGKSSVAAALNRLGALGFAGAADALIEAVRAGRFDVRIAVALLGMPDRRRAHRALRESFESPDRRATEDDRRWAAMVFAEIGSSEDVPLLEAWSATSRDAATILQVARALMRLGSLTGIDMLVRIVEDKAETAPHPRPSGPSRLRADGFADGQRLAALKALDVVATHSPTLGAEFDFVDPPKGPWKGDRFGTLDEVAAAVRAWWDASRDRLTFEAPAGRWRLNPK